MQRQTSLKSWQMFNPCHAFSYFSTAHVLKCGRFFYKSFEARIASSRCDIWCTEVSSEAEYLCLMFDCIVPWFLFSEFADIINLNNLNWPLAISALCSLIVWTNAHESQQLDMIPYIEQEGCFCIMHACRVAVTQSTLKCRFRVSQSWINWSWQKNLLNL